MRYLPVTVYAAKDVGDTSLNGVTQTHTNKLVVPHPTGQYTEQDVIKRGMVVLEAMQPAFTGCPPRFKPRGLTGHSMFGGCYVSGDSRFSEMYSTQPIQVHDRVEV